MTSISRLLGADSAARMIQAGLHKLAAERLRLEGLDIGPELDLSSAVRVLGTKIYTKRAEFSNIRTGLGYLRNFEEE